MTAQITDDGARAVLALRSMEANAFRVSQVTTRILDQHTDLPPLAAVRPEANQSGAQVALQPHALEDGRQWAAALGIELTVKDRPGCSPGFYFRESMGKTLIDGVLVMVVTCQSYSPQAGDELGAAEAAAVAA